MAPEQISSQSYSKKIDMYAAGIVLYQMLVGSHPLYITGAIMADNTFTLKQKVVAIEPEKWHYPRYVSTLAKDLIFKLCSISQIERYDAKRSLQHPWITRCFSDPIPLTAGEEIQLVNQEHTLQRAIRAMLFVSIMKRDIDSPKLTTALKKSGLHNINRNNQKDMSLSLPKGYLEKVKLANDSNYNILLGNKKGNRKLK